VTFNADGSRLASTGEDGLVVVWNAETLVPLARLRNIGGARPLAFAPDGVRLAVGLHDGTIHVWDSAQGEIVQRFRAEDDVSACFWQL
jgi:WD40 repeat protein